MVWFGRGPRDDDDYDAIAAAPDPIGRSPDEELQNSEAMVSLEAAVQELPARQREAFMLRTFEGLDVAGTASGHGLFAGQRQNALFPRDTLVAGDTGRTRTARAEEG